MNSLRFRLEVGKTSFRNFPRREAVEQWHCADLGWGRNLALSLFSQLENGYDRTPPTWGFSEHYVRPSNYMSVVMSGSQGESEKQKEPPDMFWGQMGKFEYRKYLMLLCKESTCQFRRHRFYPWIGKVPWRRK